MQNREIKFQAIHQDYKTGEIYFTEWGPVPGGFSSPSSLSNAKLIGHREFTGRKDKHGKEIYEGDIIQLFRHDDIKGKHIPVTSWVDGKRVLDKHIVKFISGTFCIWSHLIKEHRAFMHLMRPGESLEVRGNIYQTPELLTTPTNAAH